MDSYELILFVVQQINKVRSNPKCLIRQIQKRRQRFNMFNQYSHSQLSHILFQTSQGLGALSVCSSYVQSQPCVPQLHLSQMLCEISNLTGQQIKSHLPNQLNIKQYLDLTKKNIKNHIKQFHGIVDIILEYGWRKDRDLILNIMVSDGDPQRTTRNQLMNQRHRTVGVSIHQHHQYDYFVVILLSDYKEPIKCNCQLI